MTEVRFSNIKKSYGSLEVLHGIDLDIRAGEFVVFVGPSGCGKSTLLRMVAGLEDITAGTLAFDGRTVNALSPVERGIAMVFQSYALYPHMTVFDNMAFGLRLAGKTRQEVERKVQDAAEVLQITDYLDRLPRQLSGGQRQRVAIGRAIVRDPGVFLFDEPLSNLDAALRVATRMEIAKLHERTPGATMIYVTHDQVEAMTLADRIVVLNQGRIEQIGTPMQLYRDPENLFVARFIGSPSMNILSGTIVGAGKLRMPGGQTISLGAQAAGLPTGTAVSIGVRPEDLEIVPPADGMFEGTVSLVEQLGEFQLVYIGAEPLVAKVDGLIHVNKGETVHLAAPDDRIHLFDADGNSLRGRNRTTPVRSYYA
ncbi:ABC transporter ATP-binding protein [Xaviernesmea oryzae]|uniref:Alpha-glucoside transport system ATP-binding protein n=1 Tax=Xaviernesmea oryzae TaxID=464029 RepID=A0A1X7DIE1_9HYPH|nr:sn-glycerol-3-phosphate ABC transporter ATP-binding protein UgpC [Xaviernesmea oryzae]SMF15919.1 alpha-glucoside transport system ATP-binding protein [Xaviernesmea oryzae]